MAVVKSARFVQAFRKECAFLSPRPTTLALFLDWNDLDCTEKHSFSRFLNARLERNAGFRQKRRLVFGTLPISFSIIDTQQTSGPRFSVKYPRTATPEHLPLYSETTVSRLFRPCTFVNRARSVDWSTSEFQRWISRFSKRSACQTAARA